MSNKSTSKITVITNSTLRDFLQISITEGFLRALGKLNLRFLILLIVGNLSNLVFLEVEAVGMSGPSSAAT